MTDGLVVEQGSNLSIRHRHLGGFSFRTSPDSLESVAHEPKEVHVHAAPSMEGALLTIPTRIAKHFRDGMALSDVALCGKVLEHLTIRQRNGELP
jgi:hypothetical protein